MTTEENREQDQKIKVLEEGYKEIMEMLKPISETYRTVNTLGRWLMAFLVLISILLGIVSNWTSIKGFFGR